MNITLTKRITLTELQLEALNILGKRKLHSDAITNAGESACEELSKIGLAKISSIKFFPTSHSYSITQLGIAALKNAGS